MPRNWLRNNNYYYFTETQLRMRGKDVLRLESDKLLLIQELSGVDVF